MDCVTKVDVFRYLSSHFVITACYCLYFAYLSAFYEHRYFDPADILSELGSMSAIDIEKQPGEVTHRFFRIKAGEPVRGPDRTLVVKSRLSDIVGYVSRSNSVTRWMWFFGTFLVLVLLLFLSAVNSDDIQPGERPPIVLVDEFYYPSEESLQVRSMQSRLFCSPPRISIIRGKCAAHTYSIPSSIPRSIRLVN